MRTTHTSGPARALRTPSLSEWYRASAPILDPPTAQLTFVLAERVESLGQDWPIDHARGINRKLANGENTWP